MDLLTAVQTGFEKYADFNGRARRSEYWWLWLFLLICSALTTLVDDFFGTPLVGGIFSLATLTPILAAGARRLHDTDRSGWWLALPLAPLAVAFGGWAIGSSIVSTIGGIGTFAALALQVFWMVMDSMPGENRFGPSPK